MADITDMVNERLEQHRRALNDLRCAFYWSPLSGTSWELTIKAPLGGTVCVRKYWNAPRLVADIVDSLDLTVLVMVRFAYDETIKGMRRT